MQLLTIFAILLPLVGFAQSKGASNGPISNLANCPEFHEEDHEGETWNPAEWLEIDNTTKSQHGTTINAKKSMIVENYMYTLSSGWFNHSGGALWMQVERSSGKGLGRQFRFGYTDRKFNPVHMYTLYPQQSCYTEAPFNATDMRTVSIYYRK